MNSPNNFNCSTTCEGMHAVFQWHRYEIEDQVNESEKEQDVDKEFMEKFEEASAKLLERVAHLEKELKLLKSDSGTTEEELEKYKMLIAEYRKFKAKNVKHFRFKFDDNSGTFGEIFCPFHIHICIFIFKFRRGATTVNPAAG